MNKIIYSCLESNNSSIKYTQIDKVYSNIQCKQGCNVHKWT